MLLVTLIVTYGCHPLNFNKIQLTKQERAYSTF